MLWLILVKEKRKCGKREILCVLCLASFSYNNKLDMIFCLVDNTIIKEKNILVSNYNIIMRKRNIY